MFKKIVFFICSFIIISADLQSSSNNDYLSVEKEKSVESGKCCKQILGLMFVMTLSFKGLLELKQTRSREWQNEKLDKHCISEQYIDNKALCHLLKHPLLSEPWYNAHDFNSQKKIDDRMVKYCSEKKVKLHKIISNDNGPVNFAITDEKSFLYLSDDKIKLIQLGYVNFPSLNCSSDHGMLRGTDSNE